MNLVIDVGNTRIKLSVFSNTEMLYIETVTADDFIDSVFVVIEKFNCKNAIISSVGDLNDDLIDDLGNKINLLQLKSSTKVPFRNAYQSKNTLGVDRIALVAAAYNQFPKTNVLVIDAGTCITYDFITNEGIYLGGAISPGIATRYKSLHKFTKKLPLLEKVEAIPDIGTTTETSIHTGVLQGVINEIDGFINNYKLKNVKLTVVLTGGDVNFLANSVKNGIFANPNFLLEGLNSILLYNLPLND